MAIVWQGPFITSDPESPDGPRFSPYAKEIFEDGTEEVNAPTHYELIGGADFDLFEFTENGLRLKNLDDYLGYEESNKVFELTFRATHAWFNWGINDWVRTEGVQTYTVNITDIGPSVPDAYGGRYVSESAVNGDAVKGQYGTYDWSFSDAGLGDGTGGVTVTLTNDAGGRFYLDEVDGTYTLRVANAALLNYNPANYLHDIAISVSDGTTTKTGTYQVAVGNAAPGTPVDVNGAAGGQVTEHAPVGTQVGVTVQALDPKGGAVTYSFDPYNNWYVSAFDINATTGVITVKNSAYLNFEGITDGIATLKVIASDGHNGFSTSTVAITVLDKNDAPVISGLTAFTLDENDGRYVGQLTASDDDLLPQRDTLTYSLSGTDAALFTVDAEGKINFKAEPNFEVPKDKNLDNVYSLNFVANDGTTSTSQAITVTVDDENEEPVFTSVPVTIHVAEHTPTSTIIHKFTAIDPEGGHITYTTGSLDAFLAFDVDDDGNLRFTYSPDYEYPFDANEDNTYNVEIDAYADGHQVSQAITVIVDKANAAPVITNYTGSSALRLVDENWQYGIDYFSASDADNDAINWSISGTDATKFTIDTAGILRLKTPADFENPTDSNKDNVYNVTVKASDGTASDSVAMSIQIEDKFEIKSNGAGATAAITVAENIKAVTTVVGDGAGTKVYSLVDGYDSSDFVINSATGALSFAKAPNYEAPADSDGNNVYVVTVKASAGSQTDFQTLSIQVGNANEGPVISSNGGGATATIAAKENSKTVTTVKATDLDGSALTYALSGTDKGDFIIDKSTGVLRFVATPDFEKPTDANLDNSYSVIVTASDGTSSDSQALTVKVGNVNEAPVITSNGGAAKATLSIAENKQFVPTFKATDAEAGKLTWSLSGTDKGDFVIDGKTGALSFASIPDFEKPIDSDKNNSYSVTVQTSDGTSTDTQALTIKVTDVAGKIVNGTNLPNTLNGTVEADYISGLDGNDVIKANAGTDLIEGGKGADDLYGGTKDKSTDLFIFNKGDSGKTADTWDQVFDFERGLDKIGFSKIDADGAKGVQDLRFVTTFTKATGSAPDGQFRVVDDGANVRVLVDINGDLTTDMVIQVMSVDTLAISDFLL